MMGATVGPLFLQEETEALSGFSDIKQGPESSAWITGLLLQQGILTENSSGVCTLGCIVLRQRLSGPCSWKHLPSVMPQEGHRTQMQLFMGSRARMWVSGVLEPCHVVSRAG